jgi:CheY-like chemotaxis protein
VSNYIKNTIMICDDEVDLLYMYRIALQQVYHVILVDSGIECIERYIAEKRKGKKIDVLLLDYKLGDMLGDTVACKISELNGVKTVLISAYDLDEKMIKGLINRRCIVGTIQKPISLPTMLQQIEQILNKPN